MNNGNESMIKEVLLKSARTLAKYIIRAGIPYDPRDIADLAAMGDAQGLDEPALGRLVRIHQSLSLAARPASVASIDAMEPSSRWLARLMPSGNGPDMIVAMGTICVAFQAGFLLLTSSDGITFEQLDTDFMHRDGVAQLLVASLYITSAGIGACFYNLFLLYRYMIKGTYDPRYANTYYVRVILGVVAGYILAELFKVNSDLEIAKPLLAMVGGFSADAVEAILKRFVDTLKTMVRGNGESAIHLNAQKERARMQLVEIGNRMRHVDQLTALRAMDLPKEASRELDEIVKRLSSNPESIAPQRND